MSLQKLLTVLSMCVVKGSQHVVRESACCQGLGEAH